MPEVTKELRDAYHQAMADPWNWNHDKEPVNEEEEYVNDEEYLAADEDIEDEYALDDDPGPETCYGGGIENCEYCRRVREDRDGARLAARAAIKLFREGNYREALQEAEDACRIENKWGDAPGWGPFRKILKSCIIKELAREASLPPTQGDLEAVGEFLHVDSNHVYVREILLRARQDWIETNEPEVFEKTVKFVRDQFSSHVGLIAYCEKAIPHYVEQFLSLPVEVQEKFSNEDAPIPFLRRAEYQDSDPWRHNEIEFERTR